MTRTPIQFDILINHRSGTVLKMGEDKVLEGLTAAFGDSLGDVVFIEGKDIASSVRNWAEQHAGGNRVLVIGGGDGTFVTAAEQVLGRDDITLGVLPLGTQNLFARQLGFSADFNEAAAQYKSSALCKIDVGQVNDRHFLCGLVIDRNMPKFYEGREKMRDGKRLSALRKFASFGATVLLGRKQRFNVSSEKDALAKMYKGRLFLVSNNLLTPKKSHFRLITPGKARAVVENLLFRGNMTEGRLAFYAVPAGAACLPNVARHLQDGEWLEKNRVIMEVAQEFHISPPNDIPEAKVVLDGEVRKMNFPLDVKILPGALKVCRPL